MKTFRSPGILWNYTSRTIETNRNDNDYNVTKLRSLYATLLTAIAPPEDIHKQLSELNEPYHDIDIDNGEDHDHDLSNGNVRNFRSKRLDVLLDDENAEDEVSFETFHHPSASKAESINTWKSISATKEKVTYSFSDINNEATVAALIQARKVEARVVELIRSLGEVVVYGEKRTHYVDKITRTVNSGNEAVFEYFCDKNMLALMVDIVQAKPNTKSQSQSQYSGVVWTALVKVQVLQTISILISNVSDPTSLYYLLSNNYINEIIASVVPLQQWSNDALDEILPVYISFLKTLTLQLAKSPDLFQFFCDKHGSSSSLPVFPLFYAAVEVASCPLEAARDDTFVNTTALNIILNLFQLTDADIRSAIEEAYTEQRMLSYHLCNEIVGQYESIVDILIGPRIDLERTQSLSTHIATLEDTLHFINDLLWCSQRNANTRFCETVMQHAIMSPIIENMSELELEEGFHDQGPKSLEKQMCEKDEARCSAGIIVLSKVYSTMNYVPLLKMLSIALLHSYTPSAEQMDEMKRMGKDYIITPSLNAIAQNDYVVVAKRISSQQENNSNFSNAIMEDASTTHILNSSDKEGDMDISIAAIPNATRHAILDLLTGRCGDRMFTLVAILLENIFESKATDFEMLKKLDLAPNATCTTNKEKQGSDSFLEESLGKFFESAKNSVTSTVGANAIDCAISLTLCYLPYHVNAATDGGLNFDKIEERMQDFKILTSIGTVTKYFADTCARLKNRQGLDLIFNDLMEAEIGHVFSIVDSRGPKLEFKCDLASLSSRVKNEIGNAVIHRTIFGNINEVEDAKFAIRRLLLLRSLYNIVREVHAKCTGLLSPSSVNVSPRWSDGLLSVRTVSIASEEIVLLGCLDKQSIVGTDEAVQDRIHFFFTPSLAISDEREDRTTFGLARRGPVVTEKDKRRFLADTIIVQSSSKTTMILVVDTFELLVLKPKSKDGMASGTILCSTLLNNIIAVAVDGNWLHIAMRNIEDIGVLVKKGNMALRFKDASICQSAKETIDRNLSTLKCTLSSKIDTMLKNYCSSSSKYFI